MITGLAYTSMGGTTLHIEAAAVSTGTAGFKQTGQLGQVMIESSEIAYSYVRSLFGKDAKRRSIFSARILFTCMFLPERPRKTGRRPVSPWPAPSIRLP